MLSSSPTLVGEARGRSLGLLFRSSIGRHLPERTVDLLVSVRRHKLNGRPCVCHFARRGLLRMLHPSEPGVLLNCQRAMMYLAFNNRGASQRDAICLDGALETATDS